MYALVDYDSIFESMASQSRFGDSRQDHRHAVDRIRAAVLSTRVVSMGGNDLYLRFYGGWRAEDGSMTAQAELLSSVLRSEPRHANSKRMHFDLAESAIGDSYRIVGTTRVRPPPTSSLRRRENQCPFAGQCEVAKLREWYRGRCPQKSVCNTTFEDVAFRQMQKLVDTLIVADAAVVALDLRQICVVVSNDDDLVPAVLRGADGAQSVLLRIGRNAKSLYDNELEWRGILEEMP